MKRVSLPVCTLLAAFAVGAPKTAQAQDPSILQQAAHYAQSIPWQGIGMNALERARRSLALGPFVGMHAMRGPGGDMDGAISFGLGLSRLDVPIVPDRAELEGILRARFQDLFVQKFKEALAGDINGRGVNPKEIATQAWNDVLAAYLEGRRHERLEDPGLRIHVEGTRFFRADAWQARATVSLGIGPIALGLAGGGQFGDDNFGFVGVEATKPIVFGEARTPLLELFGRADRGFGDGHDDWSFAFGARFLLDVI